jgi:hypothetical protein
MLVMGAGVLVRAGSQAWQQAIISARPARLRGGAAARAVRPALPPQRSP